MTDPNIPPERVVHQTTVNNAPAPRKGGGAGLAFIVGGLLVAVAVIARPTRSARSPGIVLIAPLPAPGPGAAPRG